MAAWFAPLRPAELYLSVLVLGEVRQGIERLRGRDPTRAEVYERWLQQLETGFRDRVLPIDAQVAEAWGRLNAKRTLPAVDGLMAATAVAQGLTFVTRDTGTLSGVGVDLLDPWQTGAS